MMNFSLNAKRRLPLHVVAKQQQMAKMLQRQKMLRLQQYKNNKDKKMIEEEESIKEYYVNDSEKCEEKSVITYIIGDEDIVEGGIEEETIPEPKLIEPEIETLCYGNVEDNIEADVRNEVNEVNEVKEENEDVQSEDVVEEKGIVCNTPKGKKKKNGRNGRK
jgi:hypothetical protein